MTADPTRDAEVAVITGGASMIASNPTMAEQVVRPEQAAASLIDAVLAGERYAVTQGDLEPAVTRRYEQPRAAAAAARAGQ